MSWAEDEGYDAYDPDDIDEDAENPLLWITNNRQVIPMIELTDTHLNNIIRRFQSNKPVGSQDHKLPYLIREQKLRLLLGETR